MSEFVQKYEQTLKVLDRVAFDFATSPGGNGRLVRSEKDFRIFSRKADGGVIEDVCCDEKVMRVFVDTPNEPDSVEVLSWLTPDADALKFENYCFFPELFGFFATQKVGERLFLVDIMKSNLSQMSVQAIEGKPHNFVINFDLPDFNLQMDVCSDEEKFLVLELRTTSKTNDAVDGKISGQKITFENHQGVIPVKIVASINFGTYDLVNGRNVYVDLHHEGVCQVSNVQVGESFSKADFIPTVRIPDGTSVFMQDAPQIQYVWFDGKIVPKTNEVMLAIARGGHKFMPGPSEPRFWMMAIGILLIVYACSVKAYRHFKNKGQ